MAWSSQGLVRTRYLQGWSYPEEVENVAGRQHPYHPCTMVIKRNSRRNKCVGGSILALCLWLCLYFSTVFLELRIGGVDTIDKEIEELRISSDGKKLHTNLNESRDGGAWGHTVVTNPEYPNDFLSLRPTNEISLAVNSQVITSQWLLKYMRKVNCLKFAHLGILYMYHARKVLPFGFPCSSDKHVIFLLNFICS